MVFFTAIVAFFSDKNMDGNEERDKKQSALPKQLQEKFMTTDSAVLWRKKLNSGEHYTDLDSVSFTWHKDYFASSWVNFVSGVIKCNTCAWNIWTNYLIKKNEKERSDTALCPEINHLGLRSSTLGRAYLLRMPQRWREDMRSLGKNWNSRTISNSKETQATFTR